MMHKITVVMFNAQVPNKFQTYDGHSFLQISWLCLADDNSRRLFVSMTRQVTILMLYQECESGRSL